MDLEYWALDMFSGGLIMLSVHYQAWDLAAFLAYVLLNINLRRNARRKT